MAKEDGLIAAPEKLKIRLDMIEGKVRTFTTEAQGQMNGFIMGAADALDIELGQEGWAYERDFNRFRRTDAKRPGDPGWPPELPAELEIRPTEQEVLASESALPAPRRVRRAAAREAVEV